MMTVPEAARLVGRNPETVRRWIRSGRIRSEKVGTQHLVREEDLTAMMAYEPLGLPEHWRVGDHARMPPWEQIVRDGRESH